MIGQTVAQYEITARLGGGGMGVVYLAKDMKLGRQVALKFLPPQWCHDEAAKQRFLREAQAASATNHKNICIIHDIEQTDDGQLFIVMAHYEGPTLKQKLEAGALASFEALEIAGEIAEGLAKAHSQGVVHRDIKPGNIIVTEDGVKILDFGLAKLADAALKLTLEGSTVGTVAYMSPEQARGEEADERSDIWSIGVVLYEMLAGDVPFKGAYPEAIFYAIKNEEPAPLSSKARDLPEGVESIVKRALAKNPADRYQTAREMARELRFLVGRSLPLDLRTEAIVAPQKSGAIVRKRGMRWMTAAAVALLLGASGTYWWLARPLPRTAIAIVPVANHTGEPQLDGYRLALTQMLTTELEDSPNLRVTEYSRLLEVLSSYLDGAGDASSSSAIQSLASHSGASLLIVPSIEHDGGGWRARAEIRNASTGTNITTVETAAEASSLPNETVQRLVVSLARQVQNYFPPRWPHRPTERDGEGRFRNLDAARSFEEGVRAYDRMEYAAARAAFLRAVESDAQRVISQAWLSRAALVVGDPQKAEEAGRTAIKLAGPSTPRRDALQAAAVLGEAQADFPRAEAAYREMAGLRPDDTSGLLELADYLKRQNKNEQAIDAYHQALGRDPAIARAHVDLCQLYSRVDNYPLSEQHAQTALEKFRAIGNLGGEAQALLCFGDELAQQGTRFDEARAHIETARTLFAKTGQAYGLSRVYQYLGYLAGREHNYPAAAAAFGEAVSRSRELGNRQLEGLALMNLAYAHQSMGKMSEAVGYYEQSRRVYEAVGDERRAAEQDVNAAQLEITAGGSIDGALRRLGNARAVLRRFGYVDFEVTAMRGQGEAELLAGRVAEALRVLREASSVATERQLTNRLAELKTMLAAAEIVQGSYDSARQSLEPLAAGADATPEIRIVLARAYLSMGDFSAARQQLERASADVRRTGETGVKASIDEALGALNEEVGDNREALAAYRRVAAGTGPLPNEVVAEASCRATLLDNQNNPTEREKRLLGIIAAVRTSGRRLAAEKCSIDLARAYIQQRRFGAAIDILAGVRSEPPFIPGPELEAVAHYLRSVAIAANAAEPAHAREERSRARTLAEGIRNALPEKYRESFGSRVSIRPLLD